MVHLSYWIVPCTTYSMCCCGVLCTGSGSVSVKCRYSFEHAHPPYHFPWATSSHICIIFNRCHRKSWVSIHCHYFLGAGGAELGMCSVVLRVWYSMYFSSVVAAFFRCHTHSTSIFPSSYWERSPIRTNANVNVPRNNIIDLEIGCMCVCVCGSGWEAMSMKPDWLQFPAMGCRVCFIDDIKLHYGLNANRSVGGRGNRLECSQWNRTHCPSCRGHTNI